MNINDDICRCTAKTCPGTKTCLRSLQIEQDKKERKPLDGRWISHADFSILCTEDGCPMFINGEK